MMQKRWNLLCGYMIEIEKILREFLMSRVELIVNSIRKEILYYQRVVLFKEESSEQYLHIYIGSEYISEIQRLIRSHKPLEPIEYEIQSEGIDIDKLKINSVLIQKSGGNSFNAKLLFAYGKRIIKADCALGKAIAVSLAATIPILIDEKTLSKVAIDVASKADIS